jgi:uncharacterized protein (DUF302 family)
MFARDAHGMDGPHGQAERHDRWTTPRMFAAALALIALLAVFATAAAAQELKIYRKSGGNFDDVKFDVTNAITNRGLVADFTGNVGAMLDRTGKDVGSAKQVYKRAEYIVFCSAKLSRDMMEADAANAGFCPYIVFIYETAAKPGEVVVGYRRMPRAGKPSSIKVFAAINALLDGIAKEAVK